MQSCILWIHKYSLVTTFRSFPGYRGTTNLNLQLIIKFLRECTWMNSELNQRQFVPTKINDPQNIVSVWLLILIIFFRLYTRIPVIKRTWGYLHVLICTTIVVFRWAFFDIHDIRIHEITKIPGPRIQIHSQYILDIIVGLSRVSIYMLIKNNIYIYMARECYARTNLLQFYLC